MDDGFPRPLAQAMPATLVGFDADGMPLVSRAGGPAEPAASLIPLGPAMTGREVALLPFAGTSVRFLLVGLLQPAATVEVDGATQVISARDTLTLRCGKASITLTADGRVTIRGTDILTRAEGANRMQGASVQLN
jgi:hypothetical protein